MSRRALSLEGQRFGRLTAISRLPNFKTRSRWECVCDCGVRTEVSGTNLTYQSVRSCGCLSKEATSARSYKHGGKSIYVREYESWHAMKSRCYRNSDPAYARYGGRGISVCLRWRQSFSHFLADMSPRPLGKTLDRFPDRNGNYEPGNCRWATSSEQMNNTSACIYVERDGVTQTVKQWCRELGLSHSMVYQRLHRGVPIETAFEREKMSCGRRSNQNNEIRAVLTRRPS